VGLDTAGRISSSLITGLKAGAGKSGAEGLFPQAVKPLRDTFSRQEDFFSTP
jgi:hypothetical protein